MYGEIEKKIGKIYYDNQLPLPTTNRNGNKKVTYLKKWITIKTIQLIEKKKKFVENT
jgi:hypothetical protein